MSTPDTIVADIADVTSDGDVASMRDADAGDAVAMSDADASDALDGSDVIVDTGVVVDASDVIADTGMLVDASDVIIDSGVCMPPTSSCGGNCVDTQTSLAHCGMCNRACGASEVCRTGACSPARDCAELFQQRPELLSGTYLIDHDSNAGTAAIMLYCDKVTANGPWTVVFNTNGVALNARSEAAALWQLNPALAARSSRVLVAYRNAMNVVDDTSATTFALPMALHTVNPFANDEGRIDSLMISVNGAAPITATMRYGSNGFAATCADAFASGSSWGKVCFQGSTAPFFAGWAAPGTNDDCATSNTAYNARACSNDRRFTIAVAR